MPTYPKSHNDLSCVTSAPIQSLSTTYPRSQKKSKKPGFKPSFTRLNKIEIQNNNRPLSSACCCTQRNPGPQRPSWGLHYPLLLKVCTPTKKRNAPQERAYSDSPRCRARARPPPFFPTDYRGFATLTQKVRGRALPSAATPRRGRRGAPTTGGNPSGVLRRPFLQRHPWSHRSPPRRPRQGRHQPPATATATAKGGHPPRLVHPFFRAVPGPARLPMGTTTTPAPVPEHPRLTGMTDPLVAPSQKGLYYKNQRYLSGCPLPNTRSGGLTPLPASLGHPPIVAWGLDLKNKNRVQTNPPASMRILLVGALNG